MTNNLTLNSVKNRASACSNDISILLMDHDTKSIASLTSMLEPFSYKVMNVNVASEAISIIKAEKDIGLVIANTEMPHIDSPSLLAALLQEHIALILISSNIETKKASDILLNRACLSLKKPISEDDIKNLWEHVSTKKSQELEKINLTKKQDDIIEAFRKSIRRQRIGQASLLGRRRSFMEAFPTSQTYQKRRDIANVEPKNKSVLYPNENENKTEEEKKMDIHFGRKCNVWTDDRHMKFLAAISILGDQKSRPKAILRVINDPNLTHRQVGSHLQKYKTQVDRICDTISKDECKSTTDKTFSYPADYEYPLKASYLKENLISYNSLWYSLKKKKSSASFSPRYSFKKPAGWKNVKVPKFQLGGKLDVSDDHPFFGCVPNNSPMEVSHVPLSTSNNPPPNIPSTDDLTRLVSTVPLTTSNNPPHNIPSIDDHNHTGLVSAVPSATSNNPLYNIPSTNDPNHTGLISTGLNSDNLPGEPSNTRGFRMESARICNPQQIGEAHRNPIDLEPTSIPDPYVPQTMGENYNFPLEFILDHLETNIMDQMEWIPSTQNYSHRETNMNQMDWIPSTESHVLPQTDMNMIVPETNTNQMGWVSSGEGYVPSENMVSNINHIGRVSSGENYALPQDMVFPKPNTNHVGFVSSAMAYQIPPETNTSQMDWGLYNEGYTLSQNITSYETNPTQAGLVSCGTSHAALDTTVPLETNMGDTSLFPVGEGHDVPIEDLISFDIDVNEMDMPSWLENYDSSEKNIPFSKKTLGHDYASNAPIDSNPHTTMEEQDHSFAMHLGLTSQQHNTMESCGYMNTEAMNQRDGMEWGNNVVDDLDECMDWINKMLSKDA